MNLIHILCRPSEHGDEWKRDTRDKEQIPCDSFSIEQMNHPKIRFSQMDGVDLCGTTVACEEVTFILRERPLRTSTGDIFVSYPCPIYTTTNERTNEQVERAFTTVFDE
jgi:hypothetical protein